MQSVAKPPSKRKTSPRHTIREPNQRRMKEIPLTQGKFAIVDDEDYEILSQHRWLFNAKTGYASRSTYTPPRTVYMHRILLGVSDRGTDVDHINGDKLDNRKCNIRTATRSQNQQNQKIHREGRHVGVQQRINKGNRVALFAQICFQGKVYYLGTYPDEKTAGESFKLAQKLLKSGFEPTQIRQQVESIIKIR